LQPINASNRNLAKSKDVPHRHGRVGAPSPPCRIVSKHGKIKKRREQSTQRANLARPGALLVAYLVEAKLSKFTLAIATRSSGHASAPPPEKQRDNEQHKEYEEQEFRDARRCRGDTAKSKDRCHKRDD
jgi:hypothetical protein